MARLSQRFATSLLIFGLVASTAAAAPQAAQRLPERAPAAVDPALEKPASRLSGTWPEPMPRVTLDVEDESVADVLSELTKQADWGLAFTGGSAAREAEVTLEVHDRPLIEALEAVLEAGDLEAQMNGGTLVVKARGQGGERVRGSIELPMGDVHFKVQGHDGPDFEERKHFRYQRHKQHRDDRVVVGAQGRVEAGETVADAVAVGGSMTVAGHVRGDAVAVGGSVILEPGAVVDGDAVAIGGGVEVAEGATLNGNRVSLGGSLGGVVKSLASFNPERFLLPAIVLRVLSSLVRMITLLILGLLLLAFAPGRIQGVREVLAARPGQSFVTGFGLMLGFVPLCILLAVTLVGIPLIPVAILALIAVVVMGLVAFAVWLGYRIPVYTANKTPVSALVMGMVVVTAVDLVPIFGGAVLAAVSLAAAGAVLLSRFGKLPA
ncbi:MAG: polymer-forming cytoskeletal protein [Deltaproteobacteria bacterium]|nr:polymer-forming cytoskeletal protein [Deltaproteobacteria bacterium]